MCVLCVFLIKKTTRTHRALRERVNSNNEIPKKFKDRVDLSLKAKHRNPNPEVRQGGFPPG